MILICPADPSQAAAPRRSYHSCWNTSDSDRRGRFPHRAHKKRNQGGDGSDLPGESAKRADQSGFLFDLLELLAANHLKTAKNPNKKRHFAGSRPGCVPAIPARPGNYVPAKLLSRARRGGGSLFSRAYASVYGFTLRKIPTKGDLREWLLSSGKVNGTDVY
jgi:hypothetical protein